MLRYAVVVTTSHGFDVNTAGLILPVAGIVVFVIGVVVLAAGGRRTTVVREDIRTTPQGEVRVRERDDWG